MPTLDEQQLQDRYYKLSGTYKTGGYDGQGSDIAYMDGFLAGAAAERSAVLEIIHDMSKNGPNHGYENACKDIEQRIRQRGEEQPSNPKGESK